MKKLLILTTMFSFAIAQATPAKQTNTKKGYVRKVSDYLQRTKNRTLIKNAGLAGMAITSPLNLLYPKEIFDMVTGRNYHCRGIVPFPIHRIQLIAMIQLAATVTIFSALATTALAAKGINKIARRWMNITHDRTQKETANIKHEEIV